MHSTLHGKILSLILDGEREAASELLAEYAGKTGFESAVNDLLEPVLAEFGELWSKGNDVSLGQGYVAGKVAEDLMERAVASSEFDNIGRAEKGPIVIGNIEDDSHSLGRKLVVVFLRMSGWRVIDLGVDVPPKEFVQRAIEEDAPIIAASAMMYRTALNIRHLREEMEKEGLCETTQLAVGGAVFLHRPELVAKVGGDGTAANAMKTPALCEKLQLKAFKARNKNE